jgi:RNA polymerase sigma-70 factor (ECF subfamily)
MDLVHLVEDAQNADWAALEEILRRQSGIIHSTLYHLARGDENIDDLSQEVLMRIAKSIGTLKRKENFKIWMNQIIYNVFYDELRRKKRKPSTFSIDSFYDDTPEFQTKEIEDTAIHPDEKMNNFELDNLIRKSIKELEEPFREVVVLRELQGLSYEQIARILDTNIGTVKSRIARARARLQEKLKDYLD